MRITDVEVAHLRLPTIAMQANGTQDAAVVLVHTDERITGLGEAESSPHVVKAIVEAPRSHSVMVGLREVLHGENPLDIERLWRKMYQASLYFGRRGAVVQAISGIDIALWDLKGKVVGRPLCELLGGSVDAKVRAYASALFGRDGSETGEKAARFKEAGFTAFKFGWNDFGRSERTDRGCPIVPHHYSTGILGTVSVHVNASIPNRLFQETPAPGEGSPLNTDLVVPRVQLDAEGCVVIPKGPGLGIELDRDVFALSRRVVSDGYVSKEVTMTPLPWDHLRVEAVPSRSDA